MRVFAIASIVLSAVVIPAFMVGIYASRKLFAKELSSVSCKTQKLEVYNKLTDFCVSIGFAFCIADFLLSACVNDAMVIIALFVTLFFCLQQATQ